MLARRLLASIAAGGVLLTSCTTSDTPATSNPPGERASASVDSTAREPATTQTDTQATTQTDTQATTQTDPQTATQTDPQTGVCEPVTVVDEYGFPVEIDDCVATGPVDAQAAVAALPAGAARDGLGAALRAAEQLATDCHEPSRWTELAESTTTGLRNVASVVAAGVTSDPDLAAWVGSPAAYAVLDRIVDDATTGACAADEIDVDADPTTLAAAGRLTGAIDDLSVVLDIVGNLGIAGEFWYHADEVGHTMDLLALGPEGRAEIDVVTLGPSTMKRGIDATQLADLTGRRTYHAAVGALAVDLQRSWYEQLRDLGVAPTTVVVGLNTWIEFEACPDPQRNRVLVTDERRELVFSGVDGVAPANGSVRFVGGADDPTYTSRLLDHYRSLWLPAGGGFTGVSDEPQPDVAALQVDQFLDQPITELCPDRLERTQRLLALIAAEVPDLVVVVLPTSEQMADLHPDGWGAHDEIVTRYHAMTEAAGGRFLDRSRAVAQDRFVDLTHLGATGRAELTADLAAELVAP